MMVETRVDITRHTQKNSKQRICYWRRRVYTVQAKWNEAVIMPYDRLYPQTHYRAMLC